MKKTYKKAKNLIKKDKLGEFKNDWKAGYLDCSEDVKDILDVLEVMMKEVKITVRSMKKYLRENR